MLTNNIKFKNFSIKSKNLHLKKIFKNLKINYLKGQIKLLLSFSKNYQYSYSKKLVHKYKNSFNFRHDTDLVQFPSCHRFCSSPIRVDQNGSKSELLHC